MAITDQYQVGQRRPVRRWTAGRHGCRPCPFTTAPLACGAPTATSREQRPIRRKALRPDAERGDRARPRCHAKHQNRARPHSTFSAVLRSTRIRVLCLPWLVRRCRTAALRCRCNQYRRISLLLFSPFFLFHLIVVGSSGIPDHNMLRTRGNHQWDRAAG